MPAARRVPASTYRLQVSADFTLHDAAAAVPYLHRLGADWIYLSPVLAAEPGSNHGYDVVAHDRLDEARGGADGLQAVCAAAHERGMGVLVDIVPNHVGVATPRENAAWWSLLALGQASPYAAWFDVDWEAGGGRVRIPVVGDDDAGAIRADVAAGVLRYHEHEYPLADGTTTHDEQHYELVSWRAADHELNYRRFFAVNTLAAVRVEDDAVFDATHTEMGRWFREGLADGLRVDHPDGLRDPAGYLDRLAELTGGAYTLVEKILEPGEGLESSWATAGTTGYDALGLIDRVLTDPVAEHALPGFEVDHHELVHTTKRAVADGILGSEVRRIARELVAAVAEARPPVVEEARQRRLETTPDTIVDALAELLTCFGVYRSYLPDGLAHLEHASAEARRRRPELAQVLDVVMPVLADPAQPAALRFQQTSGMVMAKGVEDCAFYRNTRLTSLTEVGGDPSVFAVSVPEFHAAMEQRQEEWPHAMTTTSTHDTKRGEDTRARITVLAEVPEEWAAAAARLDALAPIPPSTSGAPFALLLWQAVLGAWAPEDAELRARLHAYAEKAMREAGDRTTWTAPDEAYEAAVHAAVDAAFDDDGVRAVLDDLRGLVTAPGEVNGLAVKLLALTVPGVPDVYGGSEVEERSLVDPDNRRPVDFAAHARMLDDGGHAKLSLTAAALRLRRDRPELFTGYTPVAASGPAAQHVVAFDRGGALTVVTRLPLGLARSGGWGETELDLPPGRWIDALDGRPASPRLADLLAARPVALLVREDG